MVPILMKMILLKVGFIRSLESLKKRKLKSSAVPTIQLGAGKGTEEKAPRRAAVKRERTRVSKPMS